MIIRRHNTVIHEIERDGSLFYLLHALIGAYNRRTDVMERIAADKESRDLDKVDSQIKQADKELTQQ